MPGPAITQFGLILTAAIISRDSPERDLGAPEAGASIPDDNRVGCPSQLQA